MCLPSIYGIIHFLSSQRLWSSFRIMTPSCLGIMKRISLTYQNLSIFFWWVGGDCESIFESDSSGWVVGVGVFLLARENREVGVSPACVVFGEAFYGFLFLDVREFGLILDLVLNCLLRLSESICNFIFDQLMRFIKRAILWFFHISIYLIQCGKS